jgi:hypothetical protein
MAIAGDRERAVAVPIELPARSAPAHMTMDRRGASLHLRDAVHGQCGAPV